MPLYQKARYGGVEVAQMLLEESHEQTHEAAAFYERAAGYESLVRLRCD